MAQNWYGNMGPFDPVSFKGNAKVNAVPVFVDKLPLTIGGIAGEDVKFGRVVSIDPTDNRRKFVMGCPSGNIIKGIAMFNPTIGRADPAMGDFYFEGRPMTATTLGILEIKEYDLNQGDPMEGSTVWCNNTTGELAFNDGTDISASGYTKLNAFIYESLDPNGAKVFFNLPLVATQTRETVETAVTPTATPSAGAVASGTEVALATTTPGAKILYTTDGSAPTAASSLYTSPIKVTANVTIKAIAIPTSEGMDNSSVLTAAYTVA